MYTFIYIYIVHGQYFKIKLHTHVCSYILTSYTKLQYLKLKMDLVILILLSSWTKIEIVKLILMINAQNRVYRHETILQIYNTYKSQFLNYIKKMNHANDCYICVDVAML